MEHGDLLLSTSSKKNERDEVQEITSHGHVYRGADLSRAESSCWGQWGDVSTSLQTESLEDEIRLEFSQTIQCRTSCLNDVLFERSELLQQCLCHDFCTGGLFKECHKSFFFLSFCFYSKYVAVLYLFI